MKSQNNSIAAGDKSVKYHLFNGPKTMCNRKSLNKLEKAEFIDQMNTKADLCCAKCLAYVKARIKGYNANKFVKAEHVFIEGQGSFFFSEKSAKENTCCNGNSVGVYTEKITHEGVELFREMCTNVWD